MRIAVIIPAAGQGKRFGAAGAPGASKNDNDGLGSGSAVAPNDPTAATAQALGAVGSKIELDLAGRPVFLRTIELFLNRDDVGQVILAIHPDQIDTFKFRWGDKLAFHDVIVTPGGRAERWETVLKAMELVDDSCTHIAVHDAVRPLTSKALIDRVFAAAAEHDAVIPAVPVNSTLKRVNIDPDASSPTPDDPLDDILGAAGKIEYTARPVVETVDRSDLMQAQTPQVFEKQLFVRAYAQITEGKLDGAGITDDAALVEELGQTVYIVEGESTNIKITHPADAELVEALIEKRQSSTSKQLAKKRLFADDDD